MTDDLTLAAELVREAGVLARRMLDDGLETHHKTSVSDVVSAADHAAEELVVSRLRAERPEDGLIGEEGTADSSTATGGRTWYIDPVDGTYNFLFGLPYWCAAIALGERPDPDGPIVAILGAVYHPFADELWLGGRDHPTTCNGVPVPPLVDAPLSQLSVASYLHPATLPDDGAREPLMAILQRAATVRMLGSGSIELASVAAGRLGAWAQHDSLDWDWLPGVALVTAAGGVTEVIQHRGHRWHIAGNAQAVAEISSAIKSSAMKSSAIIG
ncbi:MAG: monophosphatase [Pseudonocardiales bacterium]|nr:monophosphatase [Pseudonocardiales bacterium]MDQ1737128.1 monophosphatase [Pseudonocardiales bacterium]